MATKSDMAWRMIFGHLKVSKIYWKCFIAHFSSISDDCTNIYTIHPILVNSWNILCPLLIYPHKKNWNMWPVHCDVMSKSQLQYATHHVSALFKHAASAFVGFFPVSLIICTRNTQNPYGEILYTSQTYIFAKF